jgi:hypothetical protein
LFVKWRLICVAAASAGANGRFGGWTRALFCQNTAGFVVWHNANTGAPRLNRVQAMVDKATAQHDVDYFNQLLSKETDENRRAMLLRFLAEAEEKLRQADGQEAKKD